MVRFPTERMVKRTRKGLGPLEDRITGHVFEENGEWKRRRPVLTTESRVQTRLLFPWSEFLGWVSGFYLVLFGSGETGVVWVRNPTQVVTPSVSETIPFSLDKTTDIPQWFRSERTRRMEHTLIIKLREITPQHYKLQTVFSGSLFPSHLGLLLRHLVRTKRISTSPSPDPVYWLKLCSSTRLLVPAYMRASFIEIVKYPLVFLR